MSGQIFICYRREDTAYVTGHINDRLCEEFGSESVFTDVDNIALGVDFRAILDDMVGQCQILLAVIGEDWLTARNQEGEFRLQDPADFVRIEIESALKRNIPVIPLLVGGTNMPSKDELPDSLQDFAFRNGTPIRPAPDFHGDIDRLVNSLRKHLQALSKQTMDNRRRDSAAEAGRRDKQEQLLAETKPDRDEEAGQSGRSGPVLTVEEEEKARKLLELTRARKKQRPAAFLFRPFTIVGLVILAGASWYIDFEYREQFERAIAALPAMQGSAAVEEAELDADDAALTDSVADAITVAQPDTEAAGETDSIAEIQPETDAVAEAQSAADTVAEDEPEADADAVASAETDIPAEAESETDAVAEDKRPPDTIPDALTDDVALADTEGDTAIVAEAEPVADAVTEDRREGDTIAEAQSAEAQPDADTEAQREPDAIAEAERGAESVAESKPKLDASAIIREGVSLAALGDHRGAIQNYDEAIRLNAEPAFAYRQRGASYHALGEYEAAIKDYGQAIRLNAEDAIAYYSRGTLYHALGDYAAAIMDFDEAIRLNAEDADAYDRRSASHKALGDLEAAERDITVAAELRSRQNEPR